MWFHDIWVIKTGFCQKDFSQTNEQQRHLQEKLISELHDEIKSIQTKQAPSLYSHVYNGCHSMELH